MSVATQDQALSPDELCRVIGVEFTDEQITAITSPLKPTVVVAGAGAGKTTVMAARVVWLVAAGLAEPDAILGLTFTNKAAAELADRIHVALARWAAAGGSGPEGVPTVSTYHAYAAALLREYGLHAGFEPTARLLADASRYQLAERVIRRTAGPFQHLRLRASDLTNGVVALDSELNEHLVAPASVRDHDEQLLNTLAAVRDLKGKLTAGPAIAEGTARQRSELLDLVEEFRREKSRRRLVDFGDQMAQAAQLAEQHSAVIASERSRFSTVLLDEYQDTSIAQKRMLLALFGEGHPVTAVGDPFQAIYGWRGASVQNILTFTDEFADDGQPGTSLSLTQNNRSGGRILDLANTLSESLHADQMRVEPLAPRTDLAGAGMVHAALHETFDDEVDALADDVAARLERGATPRDIAILCRSAHPFEPLYQALSVRGVPVEVVGLTGLLERPEVADLVAVLRVLDDPGANPSVLRLLTGPRWRIGARDLALLGARARSMVQVSRDKQGGLAASLRAAVDGIDSAEVVSLIDAIHDPGSGDYSAEARRRFAEFAAELTLFESHRADPLPDLLRLVVETTGLAVETALLAQTGDHLDALMTFLSQADTFSDLDGISSITAFLAFLDASTRYEGGLDTAKPSAANTVKVMTVHKAKGLEWPVVYLPGLVQGGFPATKGRESWLSRPHVLPFALRGDAADFPTVTDWSGNQGCERFRRDLAVRDAVEERRLAYVGVTRAASTVVMTGHWWGQRQKRRRGPGDFLVEAHEHCSAGGGTVGVWTPEPDVDTTNPLLTPRDVRWPVSLDAAAAAGRLDGANLVREAMSQPFYEQSLLPLEGVDLELEATALIAEWDEDLEVLLAEATQADEGEPGAGLPALLSTSELIRWVDDPDAFAEHARRPMPRRPERAAARGTTFHEWVEQRFDHQPLIDLDVFDPGPQDADAELAALQRAFEVGPYAERVPLAVEAPFQLILGDRAISGRIDAVYDTALDDEARFELIDWKTGRTPADPLQLALYRLAWAELQGVPLEQVRAGFYYVGAGRVEWPSELPDRAALEQLIAGGALRSPT